jgi:hypothetical protein
MVSRHHATVGARATKGTEGDGRGMGEGCRRVQLQARVYWGLLATVLVLLLNPAH